MASSWTEISFDSQKGQPARQDRKKKDRKKLATDKEGHSKKLPKKQKAKIEEMNLIEYRLQLLERFEAVSGRLTVMHCREIKELFAMSKAMTFLIPATHPGGKDMRMGYQNYLDWAKAQREAGETDIAPTQAVTFMALLKAMMRDMSLQAQDPAAKKLAEAVVTWGELFPDGVKKTIPILRVAKAFSTRGQPKKFKVKIAMGMDGDILKLVTTYLSSHGGVQKFGLAPRGGGERDLRLLLEHFADPIEKDKEEDQDSE